MTHEIGGALTTALTNAAADSLLHMLGLNDRNDAPWRDYSALPGDDATMVELAGRGLVRRACEASPLLPEGLWRVTDAGRHAGLAEHARRRPRRTRAQQRYRDWLQFSEAYDVTFGEYLRGGLYMTRTRP